MITFSRLEVINEQVFDRLWSQSKDILDSGTFPWHLWPDVQTNEQKKAHIRKSFDYFLAKGIVWEVQNGGLTVMYCGGRFAGDLILWELAITGLSAMSERGWMYQPSYAIARDAFWDEVGVRGWVINTPKDKAVANHVTGKAGRDEVGADVQVLDTPSALGFTNILVTKRVAP